MLGGTRPHKSAAAPQECCAKSHIKGACRMMIDQLGMASLDPY